MSFSTYLEKCWELLIHWCTFRRRFRANGKNYRVFTMNIHCDGPWTGYKHVEVLDGSGCPQYIPYDQAVLCRREDIPLERCLDNGRTRDTLVCTHCGGIGRVQAVNHMWDMIVCDDCARRSYARPSLNAGVPETHTIVHANLSESEREASRSYWQELFGTHSLDAPIQAGTPVSVRADGMAISSDGQPMGFALDVPVGVPVADIHTGDPADVQVDVQADVPVGTSGVHPLDASADMRAGARQQERQAGDDLVMTW